MAKENVVNEQAELGLSVQEILDDYRLAIASREASLIGRKEVFMGKAKFGIFGDGKELAQLAMAKVFKNGDFRSGYYRDQTFMFAIGELSIQEYFAQLYAHTSVDAEPASGGRLMNGHFATRSLDEHGNWKNLMKQKNSSADISCTAAQMPRLLGLGLASKLYRQNKALKPYAEKFSNKGSEIAFGTIGNASTSEGHFFETINAAGVLQVPVVMSVWDDEYGISVPKEYHTTKGSISEVLKGFQRDSKGGQGYEIIKVKGWDYLALVDAYRRAETFAREEHVPVLVHVVEMTQPQGHSTSGSHERYKSAERLEWEKDFDCIKKMQEWIIGSGVASEEELEEIRKEAAKQAKEEKAAAWKGFRKDVDNDNLAAIQLLDVLAEESAHVAKITPIRDELKNDPAPIRMNAIRALKRALWIVKEEKSEAKERIVDWLKTMRAEHDDRYSSHLYSESPYSAMQVEIIDAQYSDDSPTVDGREVLQKCFDAALERDPRVFAFGEDVGKIGDVNQAFAGLQEKHGELRVFDTSIREATIIGQGIGAALRGLRPIAEIQYLDYLLYGLQTMSDDLATLQYRTKGGQKAPLIVRTRGHRLEGVWHSGSPIGMILHSLRGMYVLVPRNMTQAAGFYNTLLKSDDTALIIECLNGYRLKERVPDNIEEFTVPLGVPEVIREGEHATVVTYGSMCRIVMEAAARLEDEGISVEVIDVQTLLPFDVNHTIVESVKKTSRVIFADEDVPGGAAAFMMNKVLEEQNAYQYLDSKPITITAREHRPAYSSDGDYFSKPNTEDIFEAVYGLMHEYNPAQYPSLYGSDDIHI